MGWGKRLDLCELENAPEMQKCPRTFVHDYRFKVGDKVRISKYGRKVFDKGYTPNWTEEIFLVDRIQSTNPMNLSY